VLQAMAKHSFYSYDHLTSLRFDFFNEEVRKKFEKLYLLVWAENTFKNQLINLTDGCICSDLIDVDAIGMLFLCF
jgi:hypothetical protein